MAREERHHSLEVALARVGVVHDGFVGGEANRAQAAVAVARMLAVPSGTTTGQFADVPVSHWAAGAIEAPAERGIITGTGTGNFTPDASTIGQQMRMMIGRALGDMVASRSVPEYAGEELGMNRGRASQALVRAYRARIHLP